MGLDRAGCGAMPPGARMRARLCNGGGGCACVAPAPTFAGLGARHDQAAAHKGFRPGAGVLILGFEGLHKVLIDLGCLRIRFLQPRQRNAGRPLEQGRLWPATHTCTRRRRPKAHTVPRTFFFSSSLSLCFCERQRRATNAPQPRRAVQLMRHGTILRLCGSPADHACAAHLEGRLLLRDREGVGLHPGPRCLPRPALRVAEAGRTRGRLLSSEGEEQRKVRRWWLVAPRPTTLMIWAWTCSTQRCYCSGGENGGVRGADQGGHPACSRCRGRHAHEGPTSSPMAGAHGPARLPIGTGLTVRHCRRAQCCMRVFKGALFMNTSVS